ncbi:hypothetical protein [Paenibacillus algorifonticola]|nr:hypothetical protein [Paenibacillus algorifonticola]
MIAYIHAAKRLIVAALLLIVRRVWKGEFLQRASSILLYYY